MITPPPAEAPRPAGAARVDLPDELRQLVRPASELIRNRQLRLREEPLATAVPALDLLLDGGLPRGSLVELVGRGSCGRFAILLSALKMMTDIGRAAALVDQGEQLDPTSAADAGIDLERLLWLRPRTLPDALAAAEMLIHTGFPLVAIDVGLPPVHGRAPLAAWLRLARSATTHHAVALIGSPYRLSGCAATAVVAAARSRGRWSGTIGGVRLLHGLEVRLELMRHRGRHPHEVAPAVFTLAEAAFEPPPVPDPVTEEIRHAQAL